MSGARTLGAAEFKAKCFDILDRLASHELERVTITKRGRVVAVLTPPEDDEAVLGRLHGFMRGSVVIPDGADPTARVLDEAFGAASGELHG